MKRCLLLLILLIAISSIYAQNSQLLISENFTDYPNGNLNTATSGLGPWKASYRNNSSDFVQIVNSSPLLFPGYVSGSQYINVVQKGDYDDGSWKSPDDPFAVFKNGIISINYGTTTFYVSFLVRVSSPAGVPSVDDARPEIAIRNINGSQFANFYIGSTEDGKQLKFGINKDASAIGNFAAQEYNFNTTYLIVIRYDIANGDASADYDDKMYMWVNPSMASAPSVNSAQVAIDNFWDFNFDGGFNTAAQSLQLFQEPSSASASFDAFKVSYGQGFETEAANADAAWGALNPIEIPLPFKFGSIRGYQKNKGIQVEWDVLSEAGVLSYAIEHSADGIHFLPVGKVSANAGKREPVYSWFDPVPSSGNNYYRIKNIVTTDGDLYSRVVRVVLDGNEPFLSVYPNPASGNRISIQVTNLEAGMYRAELFNSNGQLMRSAQLQHAGGTLLHPILLTGSEKAGVYTILLRKGDFKLTKQVLLR
jgi:hypothetical protein